MLIGEHRLQPVLKILDPLEFQPSAWRSPIGSDRTSRLSRGPSVDLPHEAARQHKIIFVVLDQKNLDRAWACAPRLCRYGRSVTFV